MKKTFNLILICLLSTTLFSQSSVYEKFDSVKTLSTPFADKTDIQNKNNRIKITEADWLSYRFNNIEDYDSDFQYSVYGITVVNGVKLLLIERLYREETNHWVVYISENKKIFSHLNIAYDNYEDFLYIESEINSDYLMIKETSKYNTPNYSETLYTVDESGFYKK